MIRADQPCHARRHPLIGDDLHGETGVILRASLYLGPQELRHHRRHRRPPPPRHILRGQPHVIRDPQVPHWCSHSAHCTACGHSGHCTHEGHSARSFQGSGVPRDLGAHEAFRKKSAGMYPWSPATCMRAAGGVFSCPALARAAGPPRVCTCPGRARPLSCHRCRVPGPARACSHCRA